MEVALSMWISCGPFACDVYVRFGEIGVGLAASGQDGSDRLLMSHCTHLGGGSRDQSCGPYKSRDTHNRSSITVVTAPPGDGCPSYGASTEACPCPSKGCYHKSPNSNHPTGRDGISKPTDSYE